MRRACRMALFILGIRLERLNDSPAMRRTDKRIYDLIEEHAV